MKKEQITIWENGEYHYGAAYGFVPNIMTYLHEEKERPGILVVPGGGYCFVSPSEAEIVALKFFQMGYQAFVLTYTVNPLSNEPLKTQPLQDISRAVRLIRERKEEFLLKDGRLAVCGFSAGAHLCASLLVHYKDVEEKNEKYRNISNLPQGAVLCYPVITSGEFAHRGSFDALLGKDASEEELHYMSLETQVHKDTPPCFLWQTRTDDAVPVENSYFFVQALKKQGVPFEQHVFPRGDHGISLSNEDWANANHWENYTLDQVYRVVEHAMQEKISLNEAQQEIVDKYSKSREEQRAEAASHHNPVKEAAIWIDLAEAWLSSLL